jgi:hypothetical protein
MDCWQQISQFQQFLQCMLSQMGPFPMQGVTDGSDAKAGNIGEFIQLTATMAYAAAVATTAVVSVGVIPPGDWDLWSYGTPTTAIGIGHYYLSPAPAGISNGMQAVAGSAATGSVTEALLVSQSARGSFTVPTLLAFQAVVDQTITAGLPAGQLAIGIGARRRR